MLETKRKKKDQEEFGEYMPAYMQNELFPAEEQLEEKSRSTILKSLGILLGLLLVQIVLFYLLISFTLGFSL